MKRREFITLLGGAAAWPLAARAQQAVMPVVGFVYPGVPELSTGIVAAFRKGLNEAGFIEGRNVTVEFRFAYNDNARLPELAADLAQRRVAVIATPGSTPSALAAKAATATIPIVFLQVSDPVAQGFVANLAQPGGNITGFTAFEFSMGPKWLDLLKQMVPSLARVAVMFSPDTPQSKFWVNAVEAAGPPLGVEVVAAPVHDAGEIERAIERLASAPNSGLIVPTDNLLTLHSKLIADLTTRHRVPAIYNSLEYLMNGGLMYYGYVRTDQFRQAAVYVDRILKGATPGDLPIQAPAKFELMINLATAKALGIEVPLGLMLRVDELVE